MVEEIASQIVCREESRGWLEPLPIIAKERIAWNEHYQALKMMRFPPYGTIHSRSRR
jgi:hypothetical protein